MLRIPRPFYSTDLVIRDLSRLDSLYFYNFLQKRNKRILAEEEGTSMT